MSGVVTVRQAWLKRARKILPVMLSSGLWPGADPEVAAVGSYLLYCNYTSKYSCWPCVLGLQRCLINNVLTLICVCLPVLCVLSLPSFRPSQFMTPDQHAKLTLVRTSFSDTRTLNTAAPIGMSLTKVISWIVWKQCVCVCVQFQLSSPAKALGLSVTVSK